MQTGGHFWPGGGELNNTLGHEQNGWHFENDVFKCIFRMKVIVIPFKFYWAMSKWQYVTNVLSNGMAYKGKQ